MDFSSWKSSGLWRHDGSGAGDGDDCSCSGDSIRLCDCDCGDSERLGSCDPRTALLPPILFCSTSNIAIFYFMRRVIYSLPSCGIQLLLEDKPKPRIETEVAAPSPTSHLSYATSNTNTNLPSSAGNGSLHLHRARALRCLLHIVTLSRIAEVSTWAAIAVSLCDLCSESFVTTIATGSLRRFWTQLSPWGFLGQRGRP